METRMGNLFKVSVSGRDICVQAQRSDTKPSEGNSEHNGQ